jgi:aldehyde dehydrogenase (NAD+)
MLAPVPTSLPSPAPTESVDRERLRAVFEAQRAHRWTMSRTTAAQRLARLQKLKDAIVARRDALAEAIHRDFRKPRAEVELTEIHPTLEELNHTMKHLKRWMKPTRVGTPLTLLGTRSHVRYEARGVVLILAPWNYPFQLLAAPLLAAIAAGNCVMLKPSEKTPHTAAFLESLVRDVFEEREVALFQGGAALADALLELPFDHFFFTGSPRIGQKVMLAAAKHLAGVTLELGGKSPAIIDASADLRATAERLLWGKFVNAGQTCVAPDYVFVHESKEREFLDAAKATLAAFYGETDAAREASPDFARIVDEGGLRRLEDLLTRSVAAGAKVEAGGVVERGSRYLAPTLLSGVTPDMPVMQDEIFGPLLPVMTYRTLDEVYAHIQKGDKPLALYVFSADKRMVREVFENTSSGGAVVNHTLIHLANPNLPFGGVGVSGLGNYHGPYGFRAFSHERAVLVQGWKASLVRMFFPPYSGAFKERNFRSLRLFE